MATAAPPYWLVWNEDGLAPTRKHQSAVSAETEAKRLAGEHPGRSYVVLEPVLRATMRSIEVERFERDEIPF